MANLCEFSGKKLLSDAGIIVPTGLLAESRKAVQAAFQRLGPCVVKAQVPIGKRGKAGGIRMASTREQAGIVADAILGMEIAGYRVTKLLVEPLIDIRRELYVSILNDTRTKGPMLVFSAMGGMDVEAVAQAAPNRVAQQPIPFDDELPEELVFKALSGFAGNARTLVRPLQALFKVYRATDAELVEINPLVETSDGSIIALDCKLVVDDSALYRQESLRAEIVPEILTELEREAQTHGLKYIELDGNVGIIANGAGLTMTTIDAVKHFGGKPANFLEIGGEAYTKGKIALEILLKNDAIKSVLVNLCGAFARTDVMVEGIIHAWKELEPSVPIYFSVDGTGYEEAIARVRKELDAEPCETMDAAVQMAVKAAQSDP